MVSGELWGRVRSSGGILLQENDFGFHDERRFQENQRKQQRGLSDRTVTEPGMVVETGVVKTGVVETGVDSGCEFTDLMHEHRAMVFSVAYHFLHDRELAEE